jgi:hypothetical protein
MREETASKYGATEVLILASLCLSTARLEVSHQFCWKHHHVDRQTVTDVSKDHSAFIFTVKQSNSFTLSIHFVMGHHPTNWHSKEHRAAISFTQICMFIKQRCQKIRSYNDIDGGSMFIWSTGTYLPNCTSWHSVRPYLNTPCSENLKPHIVVSKLNTADFTIRFNSSSAVRSVTYADILLH